MYKKLAIILLSAITFSLFVTPSQAAEPAMCKWIPVKLVGLPGTQVPETYNQWLKRQKEAQPGISCYKSYSLVKKMYDMSKAKVLAKQTADQYSEWDARYTACTKGKTGLDPSTWDTAINCALRVAFIPTADSLKPKYNQALEIIKTHQPVSYIPFALKIVTNIQKNFGGSECSDGDLSFAVKVPSMTEKWKFVLPCKPPTPMQVLRTLMVLGVWIGFAIWLYRTAITWVKEQA